MSNIVIYSGGMDSFTLLNFLHERLDVTALSFVYGQRHIKEIKYATEVCNMLDIKHEIIELPTLKGSALTRDGDIPEGHYADESMKKTVVSHRNLIMLSIAASYAAANSAQSVWYGAHAGDHAIYPDCRPEFINSLNDTLAKSDYPEKQVTVRAPYLEATKGDILRVGLRMHLDYSKTWTCYKGERRPCGKCGSCVERAEAFLECQTIDPLVTFP